MNSAAGFLRFLLTTSLLFLFLHTAQCMPAPGQDVDVISGLAQGRQRVKRTNSVNSQLGSLGSMVGSQREEENRRQQEHLGLIGKRDFVDLAARGAGLREEEEEVEERRRWLPLDLLRLWRASQ